MTSTAVEPITIATVDEHVLVQRHARQREELEETLEGARTCRADLVAEREQLRRARHDRAVAALLATGGKEEQPDDADRLRQIDAEIARADATEAAARDALHVHNVVAASVHKQVEADVHQQVTQAAMDVLRAMVPLAGQLLEQNRQLLELASRVPGVLVPQLGLLQMWLSQARAVLGERR